MDWKIHTLPSIPNIWNLAGITLKRANEKELLIKDKRVITWCPRCETALAMAEIDYENKDDPSIYVKFPLTNQENEEYTTYILVWTTTPWTLPANMAVCINPDFDYAYVKVGKDVYIMAESLVDSVLNGTTPEGHEHQDIQCDCDNQM